MPAPNLNPTVRFTSDYPPTFSQPLVVASYAANAAAVILAAASNLHASLVYEEQVVKFGSWCVTMWPLPFP